MNNNPNIRRNAPILLLTGLLLGCTTPVQPPPVIQLELPLPVRPVLPILKAEELACLSGDAYARLAARNRMQRQYAEDLEVIIKSTRKPGGG